MATHRIALFIGSLRRESFNRRLADALAKLVPPGIELVESRIDDLPLYNQDDDANPSEQARRLKSEIRASAGVLFVSPEYNRSIPGVLKNAIDHASRPYGDSAWTGKPAGVIGVSIGAIGTACAQQHLRNVLAALDVPTLGLPEMFLQQKEGFFAPDGSIGESSRKHVQKFVDRYARFVEQHAAAG
jgi:chromate reductase, NAD(P)H dehydrogenase (quinone)